MRSRVVLTLAVFGLLGFHARADAPQRPWAFTAPRKSPLPSVRDRDWIINPIDAFVQARLETHGLAPGRRADRLTLLRRVTFDLTGLPPTPAEQEAFLADGAPGACERVVDRLPASPHKRPTYPCNGRDERATVNGGRVIRAILA